MADTWTVDTEALADKALRTALGREIVDLVARTGTVKDGEEALRQANAWVRERTLWAAQWLAETVAMYELDMTITPDMVVAAAGPWMVTWPNLPEPERAKAQPPIASAITRPRREPYSESELG